MSMTTPRTNRLAALGQPLLLSVGIAVICLIFLQRTASFVATEHALYGWDDVGLWLRSAQLAQDLDQRPINAFVDLGRSMHHEYNDASALPPSVVLALVGPSRLGYILGVASLIVMPVVLLAQYLFARIERPDWRATLFLLLVFCAVLFAPVPWIVTLSGMTDVAGLAAVLVAASLLRYTAPGSRDLMRWLAIGAALAIAVLLKRWYVYWVLGALFVLGAEIAVGLVQRLRRGELTTLAAITALVPFLAMGISFAAVDLLTSPLPFKILHTNYAAIYGAYQQANGYAGSVLMNLGLIVAGYGGVAVLLSLGAFAAGLCFSQTRRTALYLFVPSWIGLLGFSHVQTMETHHLLLLAPAILVTPVWLAVWLWESGLPRSRAWGLTAVACVIQGFGFQQVFFAPAHTVFAATGLAPSLRAQPEERSDLAQLDALMRLVGRETGPSDAAAQKDVYVLASSYFFNSSLLDSFSFQRHAAFPADKHICVTHDIDARDGFPDSLLDARLVLVADPVQTHQAHGQNVVTIPAQEFLQNGPFTQAFERLPQMFHLDHGVTVYVFERLRPSTPAEIDGLRRKVGVPSITDDRDPAP